MDTDHYGIVQISAGDLVILETYTLPKHVGIEDCHILPHLHSLLQFALLIFYECHQPYRFSQIYGLCKMNVGSLLIES